MSNNQNNDSSVNGTAGAGVFGYPQAHTIPEFSDESFESWENLFEEDETGIDEPTVEVDLSKGCTCGGYKTYKSFSPVNHSDWCRYGGVINHENDF